MTSVENLANVEENLLKLASWPLRWAQISGYLPLTVHSCCNLSSIKKATHTNNNSPKKKQKLQLQFRYFSVPFIHGIAVVLLALCKLGAFLPCLVSEEFRNSERTMKFVHILIAVIFLYSTSLRISGLLHYKKTLKFWKSMVQFFCHLEQSCSNSIFSLESSRMIGLGRCFRSQVIFIYFGGSILLVSYSIATNYFKRMFHERLQVDLVYIDDWLVVVTFFHLACPFWFTFLISLHRISFEVIVNCLKGTNFNCTSTTMENDSNPVSGHLVNGKILDIEILIDTLATCSSVSTMSRVRKSLELFSRLELQIQYLNELFGKTLVLEMTITIFLLLVNCYSSFALFVSCPLYVLSSSGVIIVIYVFTLYNLASECSLLSFKAQCVVAELEKMPLVDIPPDLQYKIQMLSSRIWISPPRISGEEFFNVSRPLLTSILGTVTTYLIVLLQFHEETSDQRFVNNTHISPLHASYKELSQSISSQQNLHN